MQTDHNTLSPQDKALRLGAVAQRMIVPGLALAAIGAVLGFPLRLSRRSCADAVPARLPAGLRLLSDNHARRTVLRAAASPGPGGLERHASPPGRGAQRELGTDGDFILAGCLQPAGHLRLGRSSRRRSCRIKRHGKGRRRQGFAGGNGKTRKAEAAGSEPADATIGHEKWLTPRNFIGRFVIYFVIWGFLAWYFRGHSVLQDSTGSVKLSRSMEWLSAPGMILWAFTLTGAAFDLIMSLNAAWFSTMLGVLLFADAVMSELVVLTLLAMWLQSRGSAPRRYHEGTLPRPGQTDFHLRVLLGLHRFQPVHAHLVREHARKKHSSSCRGRSVPGWEFRWP